MRLGHFEALTPLCPACRQLGLDHPLTLEPGAHCNGEDVRSGLLRCAGPACGQAYPILRGAPILVPDLPTWLAANLHLVLQDAPENDAVEAVIGAALGPDAAFNLVRQQQSTYGHDHYGDLFDTAAEDAPAAGEAPGSVRRALALALSHLPACSGPALDIGCAAGRTSFDLAAATGHLVVGIDLNWQLLGIGRGVLDRGAVSYPLRRTGNRFERRSRSVELAGAEAVDFWVADAMALPFPAGRFGHVVALNVLDCVPEPPRLVREISRVLATGGRLALCTPFDWASHATPPAQWLEGPEEVRALLMAEGLGADDAGAAAPDMAALRTPFQTSWRVRLHDNAAVTYTTHFHFGSKT